MCSPASFQVPAIYSRSCRACTPFGTRATRCLSPAPNRCGRRLRGRGWTSQPSDRHGMSRTPMRSCPASAWPAVLASLACSQSWRRRSCPTCSPSPTTCGRTCSCASRMSSPPGWPLSAPGCRWARCSTPPWTCCAPSSREWLPWTWRCWSPPGRRSTPRCSGPSQPTCTAARFVPQQDVLAAAAAVVCHAGVGTVYGALSVGVPLVVTPLAADPADLRHGLRACRCHRVPGARPATAGVPGLRD